MCPARLSAHPSLIGLLTFVCTAAPTRPRGQVSLGAANCLIWSVDTLYTNYHSLGIQLVSTSTTLRPSVKTCLFVVFVFFCGWVQGLGIKYPDMKVYISRCQNCHYMSSFYQGVFLYL